MDRTQTRRLLIFLHVPFVGWLTATSVLGLGAPPTVGLPAAPLALVLGVLQLRHSLAFSRGERPRFWQASLIGVLLLGYIPAVVFPDFVALWGTAQWFVLASLAMLLPTRWAVAATTAALVGYSAWIVILRAPLMSAVQLVFWYIPYVVGALVMGGVCLYAGARLVRAIDELTDARLALAEIAVGKERLRISRDVHDLLGQSLSAVALKGDVALRQLGRGDVDLARSELEDVVSVAHTTATDLETVAHRALPLSLSSETDRAVDLLAAAGVRADLDLEAEALPPKVDELFGWTVREAVTNILRHSAGSVCSIDLRHTNGEYCLEVENDGAPGSPGAGHGLAGLSARAAALAGTADWGSTGRDRFFLSVRVPEASS